ncbi:MAG: RidA family protein [Planctomycetaceae bacterium]
MGTRLKANPNGGFHFLPGIDPYSSGVIADSGWEIVHATLARPLVWNRGLDAARRYLEGIGRTRHSLCGVELRCPEPFSFDGFGDFNRQYHAVLDEWDLLVDGANPVARTNVAPVTGAPSESVLYGFSYTVPNDTRRSSFVVAGGGELLDGGLQKNQIVRVGETSDEALLEKSVRVVEIMRHRLSGLGVDQSLLSAVDIYTAHPIHRLMAEVVVPEFPAAAQLGVHWYHARPPVREIEFEMDLRGVSREVVLDLR